MPNNFTLPSTYNDLLEEVHVNSSLTAYLTADPALVQAGANVNEFRVAKVSTTGLGAYNRDGANVGYANGAVTLEWQTLKADYDRGTRMAVDSQDNQESFEMAFGLAGSTLEKQKVVPEMDAFTFAKLTAKSGNAVATGTYTAAKDLIAAIRAGMTAMDDAEIPAEERYLHIIPTYHGLITDADTTTSRALLGEFAQVIKTPQSRFYTDIDLLDGRTLGEELGHYKKAEAGKDINFMIIHKPSVIKYNKHVAKDVIPASMNDTADQDILKYRRYALVDVYDVGVKGIYVNSKV